MRPINFVCLFGALQVNILIIAALRIIALRYITGTEWQVISGKCAKTAKIKNMILLITN